MQSGFRIKVSIDEMLMTKKKMKKKKINKTFCGGDAHAHLPSFFYDLMNAKVKNVM